MHSLRARLLLGMVVLVLLGLVVVDVATYVSLNSFLVSQVDDQLRASVPLAAEQLIDRHDERHVGPAFGSGPSNGLPAGAYVAVLGPDGAILAERINQFAASSITAKPTLPGRLPEASTDRPTLFTAGGPAGASYRVLILRLTGGTGGFFVVAVPLTHEVQRTLDQLLVRELVISGLVLLGIVLLAMWIIRAGLRPLERMGDTATAIAAGDLSRRVSPATPRSEIGRLGVALNAMLAQIEVAFEERARSENRLRRFVADASHELRTPLTSIRGYAELLRRRRELTAGESETAHRRIEEEALRMTALVDDLLLLARLDQGRPLENELVDLRTIATDAVADLSVTAPSRPVELQAGEPVQVNGDDLRLRQVVANLLRNAVVHTPPRSAIEVSVAIRDGFAVLTVADHGPGLDEAERLRIFEPFYRADPGRSRDRGGS
ncbi:MAG: HAMP domain-containing histidine kinase, partial [Candidatus Dormibacteraeota bacterium]|nr:HAMP domain-containing histidine kinase [Candidatus Dormibacteraeota bacterium]